MISYFSTSIISEDQIWIKKLNSVLFFLMILIEKSVSLISKPLNINKIH